MYKIERIRLRVFGDNTGSQFGLPFRGICTSRGDQSWTQTRAEFDTGSDRLQAHTRSRLHRGQSMYIRPIELKSIVARRFDYSFI